MRKIIDTLIVLCLFYGYCVGQTTNPQVTFSNAVSVAEPSLWLNFNDPTTSFKDSISTLNFSGTQYSASAGTNCVYGSPSASSLSCSLTTTAGDALVVFVDTDASITLSTLVDSQGATAHLIAEEDPGNYSYAYYFADVASGSHTITATLSSAASYPQMMVFDVPGATTSSPVDTFTFNYQSTVTTQPTSGAITTTTPGDILVGHAWGIGSGGSWMPSSPTFALKVGTFDNSVGGTSPAGYVPGSYAFNATSSVALAWNSWVIAIKPASSTASPAIPQQPGFDATIPLNYSAEFPYNAFNAAPNYTVGAFDWFDPMTIMVQVDRLNWDRTGTLVLASKGDISSTMSGSWELYLQMDGLNSQLCFTRAGYGTPSTFGASGRTFHTLCTDGVTVDAMPNGYPYNIIVEQDGTGAGCNERTCADMTMYLNGLQVGTYIAGTSSSQNFFGQITVNASGGTGYANSTAFTSTGGGTKCTVTGTMNSSGGVPLTSNGFTFTADYGCTTTAGFSIVLTSPTGTGATFTYGLGGQSMNATDSPVMAPGAVSAGTYYGIAGTNNAQTPTYIDEFAEFPSALSFTQLSNIFYETKFYQSAIHSVPANPTAAIFDEDGCGDLDNAYALQSFIALQNLGYLHTEGVIETGGGIQAAAVFRQMMDQAGLANIPLGLVAGGFPDLDNSGFCSVASIDNNNASTLGIISAFPSAATVYREVMAANPTAPVIILSGGSSLGIAQFMQSSADSISPLTGLQLWAQDVANGGAVYMQGGGCTPASLPNTADCTGGIGGNWGIDYTASAYILANQQGMPMYWLGGTPFDSGPGPLSTRVQYDPMWQASNTWGSDVRAAWDSLPATFFVTSSFSGGVTIGYSGGTGYANSTPFTLSGGGPNCQGSGFMTASSGVPSGITTLWGANPNVLDSLSLGSGCTSTPTVNLAGATGTGVTLTAYPTILCGTDTVTGSPPSGDSFTSATCSNQYLVFVAQTGFVDGGAPIFSWFLNSLIDPPPNGAPRFVPQ